MNLPFDFLFSGATGGVEVYGKIFDETKNLILANIISANAFSDTTSYAKLARFGLGPMDPTGPPSAAKLPTLLPATPLYLRSWCITVSTPARVRLGVVNAAGNSFVPMYATYSTKAVAGGVSRKILTGPLLPQDNSAWFAALAIVPDATGDIRVGGDIEIQQHGGTV